MASRDIVASFAGCCGQRCMAASVLIIVQPPGTNESVNILFFSSKYRFHFSFDYVAALKTFIVLCT